MRNDFDGGERLESRSSRGSTWGVVSFSDLYPEDITPADLCLFGMPGRRCGCGFCREQVFKQREGGERI